MGIIRFVLALSVALWHIPEHPLTLVYAAPAVLGFFIISGFYMAMVLAEKYNDTRSFYAARFWRLYPAYAATAVILVPWFASYHAPTAFTTRLPVTISEQILIALLNVVIAGQDLFEFSRNALGNSYFLNTHWMLIGQAWSLSSEIFFYCLAPFVVRYPRRTLALLVAALCLRWILLGFLGLPSIWGYFFFPGSVCFFLMGSLAYHVHSAIKVRYESLVAKLAAAGWIIWLVSSVSTAGIMLGAGPQASIDNIVFWIAYMAFAASVPVIFAWSKNNRIDRTIGELSYPLYLVHGVVQGVLYSSFHLPQGHVGWALAAVCVSVLAAMAMRFTVEMPVEAWRRRLPDALRSAKPATT